MSFCRVSVRAVVAGWLFPLLLVCWAFAAASDTVAVADSVSDGASVIVPEGGFVEVSDDSSEAVRLDRMVVRDRRFVSYRPSVTRLSTEQLQGRFVDLPSVLETVSGVDVRRGGGVGSYSEVRIRGGSARDVVVYLDGVPLNSAVGGAVDVGKIPLASIDEITVYKNTAPLELAGRGIGGVINLTTDPSRPVSAMDFALGSFGYVKGGAFIGRPYASGSIRVNLDFGHADNDYPYVHDNQTNQGADHEDDDTLLRKENNDYTSFRAFYGQSIALPRNQNLTLQASFSQTSEGLFVYPYKRLQSGETMTRHVGATVNYSLEPLPLLRLSTELRGRFDRSRFRDPDGHMPVGRPPKHLRSVFPLVGLSIVARIAPTDFVYTMVTGGGEIEKFTRENLYIPTDTATPSARRLRAVGGVEVGVQPAEFLGVKLRYLHRYERDTVTDALSAGGLTTVDAGSKEHFPNAEGELRFDPLRWLSVHGAASMGVRSPTFVERFGWGNGMYGSPDLRPERKRELEVGLSLTPGPLRTSVAAFSGTMIDKIKTIGQSQRHFVVMNFNDTDYRGVEWDVRLSLGKHLVLTNALSYVKSTIVDALDPGIEGNPEPYRSPLTESVEMHLRLPGFTLTHSLVYSSAYTDNAYDDAERKQTDPVLGAAVRFDRIPRLTLTYGIDNYLDVINYDFAEHPLPGRAHYLTARVRLN